MKRIGLAFALAAAVALLAIGPARADRAQKSHAYSAAPVRLINAGNPRKMDTLTVSSGSRLAIDAFSVWADDSAQTPTLVVEFMSYAPTDTFGTHRKYYRFTDTYTANQIKTTWWPGTWIFPNDSSVIMSVYTVGATPGTLDSLQVNYTYRIERY